MTASTRNRIDYDNLNWVPLGEGWYKAEVSLKEGDSAWNPASTKRELYGPATVLYRKAPDGGITVLVKD